MRELLRRRTAAEFHKANELARWRFLRACATRGGAR
jgi:hypothetical protein